MNENNEIAVVSNEANQYTDDNVYKRVKIAKSAVRSVFEHIMPYRDANELVDYIWSRFTTDERVVIAAGSFTLDADGNLTFLMPSTARVIRYIRNGIERYEKGYTKVIVSELIEKDDRFRHFKTEKFEILAASYDSDPVDEAHLFVTSNDPDDFKTDTDD